MNIANCNHYGGLSYLVQFEALKITETCSVCKTSRSWTKDEIDGLVDSALKEQLNMMLETPRPNPMLVDNLLEFSKTLGRAARASLEKDLAKDYDHLNP